MITQLTVKNFKCFGEHVEIPLKQVNIFYGKNGRGKSTIIQLLLMLSQTLKKANSINQLHLVGEQVSLGTFAEVLNDNADENAFGIGLIGDSEHIDLEFSPVVDKPQLAMLTGMRIDGVERLEQYSSSQETAEVSEIMMGPSSDLLLLQSLKDLNYIAAERRGPVNFSYRADSLPETWIGCKGENLINALAGCGLDTMKKIEDALYEVLSGASLKINFKDAERIELFLNSSDNGKTYRPANVGFGYSYVLPVIVQAFLAKEGSLLIVENPEAHLHPGAQARLMEFLINISQKRNLQLIVESHSDHVVNGLRIAAKNGSLDEWQANICYFSREDDSECPVVEAISVDKNGELSSYPDDFMDEWTKQLLQLI